MDTFSVLKVVTEFALAAFVMAVLLTILEGRPHIAAKIRAFIFGIPQDDMSSWEGDDDEETAIQPVHVPVRGPMPGAFRCLTGLV